MEGDKPRRSLWAMVPIAVGILGVLAVASMWTQTGVCAAGFAPCNSSLRDEPAVITLVSGLAIVGIGVITVRCVRRHRRGIAVVSAVLAAIAFSLGTLWTGFVAGFGLSLVRVGA